MAPAAAAKKGKKSLYAKPAPVKLGEILQDQTKVQWKIGPSIGTGGFGEIYSACKVSSPTKKVEDYPYVVKIEPHANGPLFVEMHFYMRNCKLDDINEFKKYHKLKYLGMPNFIGSGSHDLKNEKHRFVVMPRFGRDIWKIFQAENKNFPLHTVYRLGLQLTYALEYIHKATYVHADIKGSNILLGFGKGGDEQIYLVDFGLASHYTTKDYKPDPKKMHNGTIEYTSIDAHKGIPTMRGDMEILAYNMIEWAGGSLPWVVKKLLSSPTAVQKAKEEFMENTDKHIGGCFSSKTAPSPIKDFTKYAGSLKFNEEPNYDKIRKMFEAGLKTQGKQNSGVLEFSEKVSKNIANENKKKAQCDLEESPKKKARAQPKATVEPEVVKTKAVKKPVLKRVASESSEDEIMPIKRTRGKKINIPDDDDDDEEDDYDEKSPVSPVKKGRAKKVVEPSPKKIPTPKSNENKRSSRSNDPDSPDKNSKNQKSNGVQGTGKVVLNSKSTDARGKSRKVIEFNLNLDISLDSDLVVVVNRKDKKKKSPADEEKSANIEKEEIPKEDPLINNAGYYKGKKAKNA